MTPNCLSLQSVMKPAFAYLAPSRPLSSLTCSGEDSLLARAGPNAWGARPLPWSHTTPAHVQHRPPWRCYNLCLPELQCEWPQRLALQPRLQGRTRHTWQALYSGCCCGDPCFLRFVIARLSCVACSRRSSRRGGWCCRGPPWLRLWRWSRIWMWSGELSSHRPRTCMRIGYGIRSFCSFYSLSAPYERIKWTACLGHFTSRLSQGHWLFFLWTSFHICSSHNMHWLKYWWKRVKIMSAWSSEERANNERVSIAYLYLTQKPYLYSSFKSELLPGWFSHLLHKTKCFRRWGLW